jgi:aminopeptidase
MQDPRIVKLAKVLVNYSTGVKNGDLVRISGSPTSEPLIEAIYQQVLRAGGRPFVRMTPARLSEIRAKEGDDAQLEFVNPIDVQEMELIDVSIGLWGDDNTKALTNCDPSRMAKISAARKPIFNRFLERAAKGELRWSGSQFPTNASAQDAEMSLAEYEDFVFASGHLHADDPAEVWRSISQRQQGLVDFLNDKREVRFTAPNGTDLTLSVDGRTWINCDGHENFPDGEVFTAPIEDAVNGVVYYTFPAVHGGREVHDIRLEFKDGTVVEASASKGEEFLIQMIDQDVGARTLGEVAIGTNYNITQFTKNTLFDEKIGGTFHAALGSTYPETGGKNQSGLHWDMICDLRQGGKIFVDGEVISENGRFLRPEWPKPDGD